MHDQTTRRTGGAGALGELPRLYRDPPGRTAIPKQAGRPKEKANGRAEGRDGRVDAAAGDEPRPKRTRSGQARRSKDAAGNGRTKASADGKATKTAPRKRHRNETATT